MDKTACLVQIADRLGFPDSATLLELLDLFPSDEEAFWIINLPTSAAQLSDALGQDEKRIA